MRQLNRCSRAVVFAAILFSLRPFSLHLWALAQNARREDSQRPGARPPADTSPAEPSEKSSVTEHSLTLNGHAIRYTATAGNLLVNGDDGKPYGSFFYVAYTADDVTDEKTRPITFLYNGGPGAASMWLHMGSVGPVRVETDSPQATGPAPYRVVQNQYSLLDKTDLVFIDAVGSGFSRPAGKGSNRDFAGVDQDTRAFDRFITRYITVNQRWNSPKFLMGESYGTTRSAALVDVLQEGGIECNGVILLSSILNYGIRLSGYDRVYIDYLPSYAAIAYYHNKLAQKPANLGAWLERVREFARGPYAEALAEGDGLSPQQADAIAARMSAYTGLSIRYLKEANLRVSPPRFRKELLRGDDEILGRYDARFDGTDADAAGEVPGYDPSETGVTGAFVSALHNYLMSDLQYKNEDPYVILAPNILRIWDWKHRAPGGEQQIPDTAEDLADALRKNPKLNVFSGNGLFDLATPFFATEFDLSHMNLEPTLRTNVQLAYYPSGHMIYLNPDALKALSADLESFYAKALRN